MAKATKYTPAQLDAALAAVQQQFGHRANFTGADCGYRYDGGKKTNQIVVRIHVNKKLPESELEAALIFPKTIEGVPLDVIQGDYRHGRADGLAADHQDRLPYVLGGTSCGREDGTTGSIGMLVIDRRSGRPGVLSNWHVIAGARARSNDAILHPGTMDGGMPGDRIAGLTRWMLDANGDAALALLDDGRAWLPVQYGTFAQVRSVRRSRLGETLVKSGRTTAVTHAMVDGEGSYRIRYEVRPGVIEARDIDGFKLVPTKAGNPDDTELSSGGDSGSVWMHEASGAGVGLHFAGETSPKPLAEHAIACNLDVVLDRLELDVAGFDHLLSGDGEAEHAAPKAVSGPRHSRAEFTPQPDSPDWPWWPWWPFPVPAPWQGPWPPTRWQLSPPFPPWEEWMHGAMPGRRGAPEDWGQDGPDAPGETEPENAARQRMQRIFRLFELLKSALAEYGLRVPGLKIVEPIAGLLEGPGNPRATIARAVNLSDPFGRLGLRQIMPSEFTSAQTYTDVCAVIDDILQGVTK